MLYGFLQIARSKTDDPKAYEVLSDTSRRIGAMGTAQQILYSVRNSTDMSAKSLLEEVCANARAFFSKDISINYEADGSQAQSSGLGWSRCWRDGLGEDSRWSVGLARGALSDFQINKMLQCDD
jgi:hypothetical protein